VSATLRIPAAAVAILFVAALAVAAPSRASQPDRRLNVVLIVSDDQTYDSLPHDPPTMPKFQAVLQDPSEPWIRFPNAFIDTPLCCPSRASILTGEYSRHTGVVDNASGVNLDTTRTLATALQSAGYTTALIGKYLNRYPFGFAPVAPPGWDVWLAKLTGSRHSVYYRYTVTDAGFTVPHGTGARNYSTDVLGRAATRFLLNVPTSRPFFLMFTPMAPHAPRVPARRYRDTWTAPLRWPPSFDERDVSDKPAWVRALPTFSRREAENLREAWRRSYETLGALDDAVASILSVLRSRGLLDRTVVFFLTDNGFSFGEHRWVTKSCPYDECIRTPFFVRYPGAESSSNDDPASNIDLAPTIADLAGATLEEPVDGRSLVPLLRGRRPSGWRHGTLSEFRGNGLIPGWFEMRTPRFAYVEYVTGERELYDLTGVRGPPDPYELRNVADSPRYRSIRSRLAAELRTARAG
jgi:arylsulfatase A-like enzyme